MTGTLTRELRRQLESTVRAARRAAEEGAAKSLEQLGVGHARAPAHLSADQAKLRNALRAHGRQRGDVRNAGTGVQATARLVAEVAYENWHRMLFARFLAENDLLIEPGSGMAITLDDCRELARERNEDWLALASRYAQSMLPQIFRAGDPALEVNLPPETRSQLDDRLKSLPPEVFKADDSLGWVYQFWQADNKEAVNKSEKKIGADELPAVTQLFTEDYMVWFLLHNTLGAWWAGKVLGAKPELTANAADEAQLRAACRIGDIEWPYLRFVREDSRSWRPAAGSFDGWPKATKEITLLDPCMGSGHFLVFALPILAAMRAQEEQLTPEAAIEAVLRDNLFGLELDPRCTQIAAFNLALAAWKRIGYRNLPTLHLACSGLSLGVSKAEWLQLAERAAMEAPGAPESDLLGPKGDNLFSDATRRGFERLYDVFAKAPVLGSLIQPRAGGDLIEAGFTDLEPLLAKVLAKANTAELSEMAVAAQGVAKAAEILAGSFTLVTTNVPYLGLGKQDEVLKKYCETMHPRAKADLATCFLERCINQCSASGAIALVTPQNWWFQPSSSILRSWLLNTTQLNSLATLGEEAWQSFGDRGPVASMIITTKYTPELNAVVCGIDALQKKSIELKIDELLAGNVFTVYQSDLIANPDSRLTFRAVDTENLLSKICESWQGLVTSDNPRYVLQFWEAWGSGWEPFISSPAKTRLYGGRDSVIGWMNGAGALHRDGRAHNFPPRNALSRKGVLVSQVRSLAVTAFTGEMFAHGSSPVIPVHDDLFPALWCFLSSDDYHTAVRSIDKKLAVTNGSLIKVEFDSAKWKSVANDRFPAGIPAPESDDPTQWLFSGCPIDSLAPLQVAVGRLVGYRWPRQAGSSFADCPALGPDGLERHADRDGIVPLAAIKGEAGAAERIASVLADAYGAEWSAAKQVRLLQEAGSEGSLTDWLLDQFFEQHCALFHQRPFIWHIWDGRRDGFNVLVNYHKLAAGNGQGKRLLEKLTHSYLGDWIDLQRRDQRAGAEGADARLVAAEHLKGELEKILAGEPPYDIFVRWKPLADQPIGWHPDINDGVRLNIRPFMTARPFGARGRNACILRTTPKIKWDKDRGKEPERPKQNFPWFWGWDEAAQDFAGGKIFDGNRWNDLHYTTTAKRAAREAGSRSA